MKRVRERSRRTLRRRQPNAPCKLHAGLESSDASGGPKVLRLRSRTRSAQDDRDEERTREEGGERSPFQTTNGTARRAAPTLLTTAACCAACSDEAAVVVAAAAIAAVTGRSPLKSFPPFPASVLSRSKVLSIAERPEIVCRSVERIAGVEPGVAKGTAAAFHVGTCDCSRAVFPG